MPPPNENKGLTQNSDVKVDKQHDARMKARTDVTKTICPPDSMLGGIMIVIITSLLLSL